MRQLVLCGLLCLLATASLGQAGSTSGPAGLSAADWSSLRAAHSAYLKASDTDASDEFGWSVAVSGDTVVVGAPQEDSSATGVNGDRSDDGASASGAAYVFVRDGANWSQQAYLKASNTGAFSGFGYAVAISGDTIVVGAHGESSSGTDSGAVYVFVRNGTSWSQQAYLQASNAEEEDHFGYAVAVSGDTLVVGAPFEDSGATGVGGDQGNHPFSESFGAAYVFARSGTSWSQQAYLKASNSGPSDLFGFAVAMSGDALVVGALFEDSNATGVNGSEGDNSASGAGAAYVFARSGTSWSQQAYVKASNTGLGDNFGASVALSGDTLLVGAYGESSSATGVGGDQGDNSAFNSGAAYVFTRSATVWSQQAYLKASNTAAFDEFGTAVALSGDTAVVGAWQEDSSATGVGGEQADNGAGSSGAAYLFVRSGTSWSQQAYLKASNTGAGDQFGWSAAVSGETVVVGAPREDSGATGVDGDESDNGAFNAGAAYVLHLEPWTDLGGGTPGIAGVPELSGSGPLTAGSVLTLDLQHGPPGALALLWLSTSSTPIAAVGGTVHPVPFLHQVLLGTDGAGALMGGAVVPPGLPPGTTFYFQYLLQDASVVHGITLSNGVVGTAP